MYQLHRILFFRYSIYALLGILVISLFKMQIIDGAYYRKRSENNRIRLIPIKATRGRILDRNSNVLADNQPSFNLYVIPKDFYHESYKDLSEIINIPELVIKERVEKSPRPPFIPIILKRDMSQSELHMLEEMSTELGGIVITVVGKRYYPWNEVGSHVIGYLGKISKKEYSIKKHLEYLIDDYIGRLGIEYIFEEVLRGSHGGRQIEVDSKGREMKVLAYKTPFSGTDIMLSIDIELQEKINELIKDESASICLIDLDTGEILVLISNPGYDPNAFVTPSRSNERLEMLKDKSLPFINRAISSRYPPGSVFKVVTALAALEAGTITPDTIYTCKGAYKLSPGTRKFHCWSIFGHGEISLVRALQESCNIYFYKVGRYLGADNIAKFAKRIGLGDPVPIELPNVAKGLIPSTKWKKEHMKEPWYQGETLHYAIGQGFVSVTPLQVLRLISIIANDGVVIEPTIVKGVKHARKDFAIKKAHIDCVKQGMLKAVETKRGTGHLAHVDFVQIAGKTGTAETKGEPHSWFAGFFPYKNPQIAMVIVVEHGGVGGGKAAQIAKDSAIIWNSLQKK